MAEQEISSHLGNQAKPFEMTGTSWVMRCYVESLAIYPVAAHRSSDYVSAIGILEPVEDRRIGTMNTARKSGGGSGTPDDRPCKPQAGERLYRWPALWRSGAG